MDTPPPSEHSSAQRNANEFSIRFEVRMTLPRLTFRQPQLPAIPPHLAPLFPTIPASNSVLFFHTINFLIALLLTGTQIYADSYLAAYPWVHLFLILGVNGLADESESKSEDREGTLVEEDVVDRKDSVIRWVEGVRDADEEKKKDESDSLKALLTEVDEYLADWKREYGEEGS
jgi:hypothetical protein